MGIGTYDLFSVWRAQSPSAPHVSHDPTPQDAQSSRSDDAISAVLVEQIDDHG